MLEDDREYFPTYNVALVVRQAVLDDYPQSEDLIAPVTMKLTDKVLLLNAEIDVEGHEPADVAHGWLQDQGSSTEVPPVRHRPAVQR